MTCSALRKTIGDITELAKDTSNEQMHAELELRTKSSRSIRQLIMHLDEAVESTDREWLNQALDFGCSLGWIVRGTACTHVYYVYRCIFDFYTQICSNNHKHTKKSVIGSASVLGTQNFLGI